MHPCKVAGLKKNLDCCRILDSLYIQLLNSNPDYVKSQQSKEIKKLEQRLAKAEKAEKSGSKINRARFGSRKRSNSEPRKGQGEKDETFLLKKPNEKESEKDDDDDSDDDEDDDMFDPNFISKSAKSTLRPIPKMTSGAMLNTLTGMTKQKASSLSKASGNRRAQTNYTGSTQKTGNVVGSIMPINPTDYEIENDSPLVTFLHSVDAYDIGGILLQEKMDMDSLMLCSEDDLKSIGLALGPRKKIISGLSRRTSLLSSTTSLQMMTDTDL